MKKVRGFNRQVELLARAWQAPAAFSAARLQQFHYDYAKLGLGLRHWLWHDGRQPPRVVRQLAAAELLQTLFRWQELLMTFTEPVYLAIWLTSLDFVQDSQLVAAIQGRINRYETTFGEAVPTGPPLPPEYQALPGADRLTWTTHRKHEWLAADDFPHGWPARLLRHPHTVQTLDDGRRFLVVARGWVWVGQ